MNKLLENDAYDGDFEDISELQQDIDDQIRSITQEFDTDENDVKWSIKIYRILDREGELSWCFSCLPSELPILDRLRDDYGGGKFEVRIYKNGRIFKRPKYRVEPPVKKPEPRQENDTKNVLMAMMDMQQRQMAELKEVMATAMRPQQSIDPMAMQMQTLTMLATVKDLFAPAQSASPMDMMDKMLGLQTKLKELVGEPNGEQDALTAMIHTFGPPLVDMAQKMQDQDINRGKQMVKNNAPVSPALNNPSPRPARRHPQQTQDSNPMRMQLLMLTAAAEKNVDTETYANMVIDHSQDLDALMISIKDGTLFKRMIEIHPPVADHKIWFDQLGADIIELLTPEEESVIPSEHAISMPQENANNGHTNVDPEREGGHVGDVKVDEAPNEGG